MTGSPDYTDPAELSKISYLDISVVGGRDVPAQPYFDGTEWQMWLPGPNGLVRMRMPNWCQGRYFAKAPAGPDDGIVRVLEFLTKFAYFPDIAPVVTSLEHDVVNLASALWKTDVLFELAVAGVERAARVAVATDLEYILVACRSMLDLMQLAVCRLWHRMEQRLDLPRSFARMVLDGESVRTAAEIQQRFRLPLSFAEVYARHAPFAASLRSARDAIVHSPIETPMIFALPDGFAVPTDRKPFSQLAAWPAEHLAPNGLGSLRYLLASVVLGTLTICEEIAVLLRTRLTLPGDIAPGLHVFMRFTNARILWELDEVVRSPWRRFAEVGVSIGRAQDSESNA